jgi:hypothetical protein
MLTKISDLPSMFMKDVIDMSKGIQKKMREYCDAVSGKNQTQYVSLNKKYFDYIENLKKGNPEKYKRLVYFATIYPTLDIDDQNSALTDFLKDY